MLNTPDAAPSKKTPLKSKTVKMKYGAVAVTQTTLPDDLTPLNLRNYVRKILNILTLK